ncbi:interleukin 21 receptor, tandem duplicate 1 isoform X2 [Mastacembelus armatus]|uniref:interleukin 21 receptor, tandem duplicate 1 isoform X2 n=1 Tax=Mastacembelus armatus TaxID=205130 RepID=UPI000E45B70B|nr:interleukin-21 receptor-like isoform X2 [Mastacembelus armatus]
MAVKPVCLLLLWELTLLIHGVASSCNVTCSTDYDAMLNCSCSGSVQTHPVRLKATCSDDSDEVNGTCEVKPPQTWCIMNMPSLYDVASIGTICNTSVSQQGNEEETSESSSWELSDVVKPQPPFNIQVTKSEGFYNITWDDNSKYDCLEYRVRIRESKDLSKDPTHSPLLREKYISLDQSKLRLHFNYTVDVQAKMCPENTYTGPWSEWSYTTQWRTETTADTEVSGRYWYVSVFIIPVLGLLLLGFSRKPFWQKKLQLITYVPKPNDFFKPLYHNYGGNFKEWVKPVFSERDYQQINSQHDILHWNNEKQSYSEDSVTNQSSHFLSMLQPHSNLLLHPQDSGSSQGTGHSTGHISIHTVTLSGEEFGEEIMSQNSINTLRSYQDEESFGSFEEDNRQHTGCDLEESQLSRMGRQSGILPQHDIQISNDLSLENINFQLHVQFNEPERVSLDSFISNEQSEDGYPHVDLDTIDSGFAECSSPGALDSDTTEQIDCNVFHEHKNSNSNYVKQWMICNTIQEDSSNVKNELQEMQ